MRHWHFRHRADHLSLFTLPNTSRPIPCFPARHASTSYTLHFPSLLQAINGAEENMRSTGNHCQETREQVCPRPLHSSLLPSGPSHWNHSNSLFLNTNFNAVLHTRESVQASIHSTYQTPLRTAHIHILHTIPYLIHI